MSNKITMAYDESAKVATYTFENGRQMKVRGVTLEKAQDFLERSAPEFAKRDCCLSTVDGQMTREGNTNG